MRLPDLKRNPSARAIATLALTQIIGWGTTYSLPAILVEPISRDLGVSSSFVFAGISAMLLVNAAVAPFVGNLIDRIGAARVLQAGSLTTAVGLLALGASTGPVTYLAAWAVLGLAMASALATPAFAMLVEISGAGARRDIATLTLFTGVSSTIFWPIMLWLLGVFDWRQVVWLFALLHIAVCLPLHFWALPQVGKPDQQEGHAAPAATGNAPTTDQMVVRVVLDAREERRAFWLVAIAFAAAGFVGWGLALQLPEMFKDLGLDPATAIAVAALSGPVQVTARGFNWATMGRTRSLDVATLACCLLPTSLIVVAVTTGFGTASPGAVLAGLLVFIAMWGTANGLLTVARAALPLELFDARQYGRWMGRLAVLQNIAFAIAPVMLAAALHRLGPLAAIALAAVFALVALGAMVMLTRLVADARRLSGA